MQYLIQTLNSLYGLKIEKGKFTIGKLMKINESPAVDVGDTKQGDEMVFDPHGCISIFNKGEFQLRTSPVINMNLVQTK
ncbi:MAG: hypothetical protein WC788_01855 [Candidatus Paceibacterota bacterium]|jgi:hypothetical protein